jgi:hypothetical protein
MNAPEARFLAVGVSALALALLSATTVRADRAAVPLGELVARSNHVVIGVVRETLRGTEPGAVIMHVTVEETLSGPALATFSLRHSPRDPDAPAVLEPGTRVLAFLERLPFAGAAVLAPVGGEQGVVSLQEDHASSARMLALRAVDRKGALTLGDVQDLLRNRPLPRPLVGSLLQDLSPRVSRTDAAAVTELVCDPESRVLPAVQDWAMRRVSALGARGARPCLEAFARDRANRNRALAAIEALGDLKDAESAAPLRAELEALQGERLTPAVGDSAPPPTTGPSNDPEDEADPQADPEEGASRRGVLGPRAIPRPLPNDSPAERDGEVEPDDASDEASVGTDALAVAAALALGKLGDAAAVPELARVAWLGHDFALHSTAVHALGLIGGASVREPLEAIARNHPDPLVRAQARDTLAALARVEGGVR